MVFLRSVADVLAPHEEAAAGTWYRRYRVPFFYILYLKRKGKMLFMFFAFLIRVIWTEVLRAFRSPWLHFVRIKSKLLYTAAFLILGPTIKEEEVKTL